MYKKMKIIAQSTNILHYILPPDPDPVYYATTWPFEGVGAIVPSPLPLDPCLIGLYSVSQNSR
jgi:hypothetical protein